jgi:hypothetical protein
VPKVNQAGSINLLVLTALLGIIAFLMLSNLGDFKNRIFSFLYQKPSSFAAAGSLVLQDRKDLTSLETTDVTIRVQLNTPYTPSLTVNSKMPFSLIKETFAAKGGIKGNPSPKPSPLVSPSPTQSIAPSPQPSQNPSLDPSITPSSSTTLKTTSIILAEDPSFTKNAYVIDKNTPNILPLNTSPYIAYYTFSDPSLGTKTLYAKFINSDGSSQIAQSTINLIAIKNPIPTGFSYPSPKPSDFPVATSVPNTMELKYEEVWTYAPFNCYHEDYWHTRYWQGSINPGETMTIPMPYCNFTQFNTGPGADGLFTQAYGMGSFTLTTISPSGQIYTSKTVATDGNYRNLKKCNIQPKTHLSYSGGEGTIESETWSIKLTNTGTTILNNLTLLALSFQNRANMEYANCPQSDWNLVYP